MISELESGQNTDTGQYTIYDGVATHVYADPVAYRRFNHTWRALRAYAPNVEFTLNDDATIATWIGTPVQPTQTQINDAVAAFLVQQATQAQATVNLRSQVLAVAQSCVGVRVDQLTALQVRAMVALLLYREDGLATDLTVKPLIQWVRS